MHHASHVAQRALARIRRLLTGRLFDKVVCPPLFHYFCDLAPTELLSSFYYTVGDLKLCMHHGLWRLLPEWPSLRSPFTDYDLPSGQFNTLASHHAHCVKN